MRIEKCAKSQKEMKKHEGDFNALNQTNTLKARKKYKGDSQGDAQMWFLYTFLHISLCKFLSLAFEMINCPNR